MQRHRQLQHFASRFLSACRLQGKDALTPIFLLGNSVPPAMAQLKIAARLEAKSGMSSFAASAETSSQRKMLCYQV